MAFRTFEKAGNWASSTAAFLKTDHEWLDRKSHTAYRMLFMRVTITAYAATRDYLPERQEMEIPDDFSVKELMDRLARLYPSGKELFKTCRIATSDRILREEDSLASFCELSLFPPSSGG